MMARRKFWVLFLLFQSLVICTACVLTLYPYFRDPYSVRLGGTVDSGGCTSGDGPRGRGALVTCYRGFPFVWSVEIQRYYPSDLQNGFYVGYQYDSTTGVLRNPLLPVMIVLFVATGPWVLFRLIQNPHRSRCTQWMQVICIASVATFALSILDSLMAPTGRAYDDLPWSRSILQNKYVNKHLRAVRTYRLREFVGLELQIVNEDDRAGVIGEHFTRRTGAAFALSIIICGVLIRPWRKPPELPSA